MQERERIGDLIQGERLSDGERECDGGGHDIAFGQPMYWPHAVSQYDDSDPFCREHAIERALERGYITASEADAIRSGASEGEGVQDYPPCAAEPCFSPRVCRQQQACAARKVMRA